MPKGYWKRDPGGIGWFWTILDKISALLGLRRDNEGLPLRTLRSPISREVTGTYQMYDGHDPVPFMYRFDEELTCILHVRVRVKLRLITASEEFYPWDDAQRARLEEKKTAWAEGIRRYWSNKYYIDRAGASPDPDRLPDQYRYPCQRYTVVCDVEYVESGEHREVFVPLPPRGDGTATASQLDLESDPESAAHEYGHWIGQPHDENESIMNGGEPSMKVWPWHYRRFAEILTTETGQTYTVGPPVE